MFRAAREIIDLIEICQKKDKLPQSTIVLFAIWTAAFVVLYAIHFPQMDVQRHVLNHEWNESAAGDTDPDVFRHGPLGLTFSTLSKMAICLNMASTYMTVLQKMDTYFVKIKRDYEIHVDQNRSLSEKTSLSVRLGGKGAGLEEYKKMPLKEFGHLGPLDLSSMEDRSRASTIDRGSPIDNRLPPLNRVQTPRSGPSAFTAINHASNPASYHDTNGSASGTPADGHSESWNRPNTLRPIQSYASSAVAMLGPESAGPPSAHRDDISEYELESEERKRFNVTNDLGILTQNNDPWIDGQMPFFDLSTDPYGIPNHFSDAYT